MPEIPYTSNERHLSNNRRRRLTGGRDQFAQLAGNIEGLNQQVQLRKAFNEKVEALNTKNQVTTAEINAESQLMIHQDKFNEDPLGMTPDEYNNGVNKIMEDNATNIEDLDGKAQFQEGMQLKVVKKAIEAKTARTLKIVEQGKNNLQRAVDRISGPTVESKIGQLNSYYAEATANGLVKPDEAYKAKDDAKVGFAEQDVTKNPYTAPQVIEDLKAGKYKIEDNNKLKKAISSVTEISLREKKILDLNTKLAEVEAIKTAVGIENSDMPYRKKMDALDKVKGLKDGTKKQIEKNIKDVHTVDAKTDKDTFNGFILELSTIDSKSEPDIGFSDAKDYLDSVQKLKDRVISKRRSLSTENYNQLMEDIDEKTAIKMDQSIGKVGEDDSFLDMGIIPGHVNFDYADAEAMFTNTFMGDEDLPKEAMIEYYYRTRGKKLSNDEKREKAFEVQKDVAEKVRTRVEGLQQQFNKPQTNFRWSEKLQKFDESAGVKGPGFFGPIPTPDGKSISTELSRARTIDGEMVSYPLLNPYLTNEEIVYTLMGEPNRAVEQKAKAWAIHRKRKGKSPFLEEGKDEIENRVIRVGQDKKTGKIREYIFADGETIKVD